MNTPSSILTLDNEAHLRQKVVKSPRVSERKYSTFFTEAWYGLALIEAETGLINECNPYFERLVGQPIEQLRQMKIWEIQSPEKADLARRRFLEVKDKSTESAGEFEWQRPDGQIILVEFAAKKLTIQDRCFVQAIAHDITRHKQVEEALRASESRYKRLLESATDYIYTVKIEQNRPVATSHGAGCAAVTGYTPEEYAADPHLWFRMIYDEDRPAVAAQIARLMVGEPVAPLEHRLIHQDGSIRWVRNTPVPRCDEQGGLIAYDGLITDITERKRLEEEKEKLQLLYLQAQKLEAIGQLTGGIAHNFNNLLTSINGFAELLQHRLPSGSPFQPLVTNILNSGRRAAELVRQLMTFSRKGLNEPKVVDLNQLITEIDKLLRPVISENIQLKINLAPELWPVKVDPTQFEQVILNLVVNARDAMPDGGWLMIETANVVLDETYTTSHFALLPGEYVRLSLSDNGCGLSAEVKAHLFEPFFTTKKEGQGTGLGLATVYGIVKQSGGDIQVYSQEGVGATFKIYLPASREGAPQAAGVEDGAEMLTGSETILVVEDDFGVRNTTQQILEKQGYTLLSATNGAEALQLSTGYSAPIHLLLTDVILPDMNGPALAEELRQSRAGLKILFMSGYGHEAIARHGLLEPGLAFIQKPFPTAALVHKVRALLDG